MSTKTTNATQESESDILSTQEQAEQIIAQAKARAAAIVAEAQAQARAASVAGDGEERVSIRLFKDNGKYKDDVFVAVNGERIQIKRGETVRIKKKFAEVLEQSMIQDAATASMIERESSEYRAKAEALGL